MNHESITHSHNRTDVPVIGVIGAGVMGRGITTLCRLSGYRVVLIDTDPDVLNAAGPALASELITARTVRSQPADTLAAEVTLSADLDDLADAVIAIEAVTEDIAIKTAALAAIEDAVRAGTVLITNTSGITVRLLAESLRRKDMLGGIHFMNPAWRGAGVEVIRSRYTSDETATVMLGLLRTLGLEAVPVGDAPGFVINALLQPMIANAISLIENGVADVATIDRAMRLCLGHPAGPLAIADLIGLRNVAQTLDALLEQTGNDTYAVPELLRAKVSAGQNGRRSGQGFHRYAAPAST